jgi:hypothetical protein
MSLTKARILVVILCCFFVPSIARADDDKASCVAAYSSAQDLRAASKLVEAQRELRVCARATCSAFIVRDCTQWLEEVESSTPTIVVSAKDEAGHDVTDVVLTLDGTALAEHVDGRALAIDPGPHALVCRYADYPIITQNIVVRTAEKNRVIDVVFAKPPEPVVVAHAIDIVPPVAPPQHETITPNPLRPIGIAIGAVGVAALITGGIAGIAAIVNKGDHCVSATCDPGTVSSLSTETTLATIGIVAGAVLTAAGVTLMIIGKPRHAFVSASIGSLSVRW